MEKWFNVPEERYLNKPENESCYEYLLNSYERVSEDLGKNYTAFVTPVANTESETKILRLLSDIEKTASFLYSKGIRKGDVITVFLPNCAHCFTAFYALSKIGAISAFVHPLTPPNQLLETMKHTKSKGIFMLDLFSAAYDSVTKKYTTIVCSISDYCNETDLAYKYAKGNELKNAHIPQNDNIFRFLEVLNGDYPEAPTDKNPGKDDAIYLGGGGTTGKSKTIIHSAFSFNSLAYSMYLLDVPHDYEVSYSLCVLPCFHAYGLGVAMHYALCNAYKPILISKFDPARINALIAKYQILEILGVPKMFEKLMALPEFRENDGLKYFKVLAVGGDVISTDFIKETNAAIASKGGTGKLARGYGLTEMCAVCTSNNLPGEYYRADTAGKPIYSVEIEIWNDNGEKLPFGTIGEIVITGNTMMNGYLTEDGHDTGIYTDKNGKKWIKTGDIGYLTEDGHVMFASRKKRVIIISGYNIYPATIEDIVRRFPYIEEVCAVQGYDENAKPCVKLCVSLTETDIDKEIFKKELLDYCKLNIESYACPRKVEFYDFLPRTKMEKIDFVKLSDPVPNNR